MRKFVLGTLLLGFVSLSAAWADDIPVEPIDPQLYIGSGAGTPCATGCAGEPNRITSAMLDIYIPGAGNSSISPMLLILGIPDHSGPAPTISSVTSIAPYPGGTPTTISDFSLGGPNIYVVSGGMGWDAMTGFVGSYTNSPTTPQVYSFVGLRPPTDASNNVSNWFGPQETAVLGYTPESFGIYVYRINAPLAGQGLFDVTWSGTGLQTGTLAIGYAQDTGPRHIFSTPWTVAGQVQQVPEPATLSLVGIGLIGLAGMMRRRLRPKK